MTRKTRCFPQLPDLARVGHPQVACRTYQRAPLSVLSTQRDHPGQKRIDLLDGHPLEAAPGVILVPMTCRRAKTRDQQERRSNLPQCLSKVMRRSFCPVAPLGASILALWRSRANGIAARSAAPRRWHQTAGSEYLRRCDKTARYLERSRCLHPHTCLAKPLTLGAVKIRSRS